MSDRKIDKSKRSQWLIENGPPDVLERLGLKAEALAEKAEKEKIKYKENSNVEEETQTFDALDSMKFSDDTITSGDEGTSENETPTLLNDILKDHVTEQVAQTPEPKIEEQKTNVPQLNDEQLAEKARNDELVDTLLTNLINPVLDIIKEFKDENQKAAQQSQTVIQELTTRIATLEKSFKEKGIQEDMTEITPVASVAAQVQERLVKYFSNESKFGKPLTNEEATSYKGPKQNKNLDSSSAAFTEGL